MISQLLGVMADDVTSAKYVREALVICPEILSGLVKFLCPGFISTRMASSLPIRRHPR